MGIVHPQDVVRHLLEAEGIALLDAEGTLRYDELRALVQQRAKDDSLGEPGTIVALECTGTRAFLVGALAAWSRGAAVMPLDSKWPSEVARALRARLAPVPHEAMLILATSGSSGAPKLVVLSASGILHNLRAILGYLPVREAERIGLCSPLSYSYGLVGQALCTLYAGVTLVDLVASPFPEEQIRLARAHGVRGISSVPTHLRRWASMLEEQGASLPLRFVGSAGAHLDAATASRSKTAFEGAELFRQYGLTECSPRVAAISDRQTAFARGATGFPIAGAEARVLRADGSGAAPGELGDLWVRSPSCMMHYLSDVAATSAAMDAEGWLRTGDAAHLDAEGYLYIAGRVDGVVKCAGERVSVDEVAEVIRTLEGVQDAVVVALPHPELGHELHAFVQGDAALVPALRAMLRSRLSVAKRPGKIVCLAEIPRTPNGKWDLEELKRGGLS